MDGVATLKLLMLAGKRLESLGTGDIVDDRTLRDSSRAVSEAGEAVARFRRLGEVQELMLEVTALVEAGVDPVEVGAKLGRAMRMANELAIEFGLLSSDAPPMTSRAGGEDPTPIAGTPSQGSARSPSVPAHAPTQPLVANLGQR
jgi:hypothetical protein